MSKKSIAAVFGIIFACASTLLYAQELPPIDRNIPAGLKTASFALG